MEIKKIKIADIKIGESSRSISESKIQELAYSIKRSGLDNPITVDEDLNLIAGEHRVEAFKLNKETEIFARIVSKDRSDTDKELLKIDENLVRKELTPLEKSDYVYRKDQLLKSLGMRLERGKRKSSETDGLHTTEMLAEEANLNATQYRKLISIAKHLDPKTREIIESRGLALGFRTEALHILSKENKDTQKKVVVSIDKDAPDKTLTQKIDEVNNSGGHQSAKQGLNGEAGVEENRQNINEGDNNLDLIIAETSDYERISDFANRKLVEGGFLALFVDVQKIKEALMGVGLNYFWQIICTNPSFKELNAGYKTILCFSKGEIRGDIPIKDKIRLDVTPNQVYRTKGVHTHLIDTFSKEGQYVCDPLLDGENIL